MRAPEAPTGCPSAIAPPLIGLCEIETKVTDNGERLGSKGLVGLDKIDVIDGETYPLVVMQLINAFLMEESPTRWFVVLGALLVIELVLDTVQALVSSKVGEYLVFDTRNAVIDAISRWSMRRMYHRQRGDLIAVLSNDATSLREVVSSGLLSMLSSAVLLVSTVALLAYIDWKLLLITVR